MSAADCVGARQLVADTGSSLQEVTRLKDLELGGLHTVRWHNGYLYVLEDGATLPEGFHKILADKGCPNVMTGQNRISRYTVSFGNETPAGTITRE